MEFSVPFINYPVCAYAQQGYAFGRIGLCIPKNWLFEVLPLENLLGVSTALSVSLTTKKGAYYTR